MTAVGRPSDRFRSNPAALDFVKGIEALCRELVGSPSYSPFSSSYCILQKGNNEL